MKYTGKLLALAMVLATVTACAVGCVGPESDDSGVNENTDTTTTTTQTTTQAPTTQAPTTQAPTTEAPTTENGMGSIAGDVSEAVSDAVSGGSSEAATTQTPSRNGRMRGREGK